MSSINSDEFTFEGVDYVAVKVNDNKNKISCFGCAFENDQCLTLCSGDRRTVSLNSKMSFKTH